MTTLTLQIEIDAPPQRCFDLARSMDFHTHSMRATGERIVGGCATGLISLNDEVEFEARHLGLTRRLCARIATFDPPRMFADEQVRGPFRSLRHEHRFESMPNGATRITDVLTVHLGYGPAGIVVERLIILPHLRRLIGQHQQNLKVALESDAWRKFLPLQSP